MNPFSINIGMAIQSIQLPVGGMTCNGCVRTIEKKLSATPGVVSARVSLEGGSAMVDYDPERAQPADLVAAIEKLGYTVPRGA